MSSRFGDELVEGLFRSRYSEMVGLAVLITGSRDVAEDAVQDAFAGVFRKAAEQPFDDPAAAGGYLVRSVVNACRSHLRRTKVARAYVPEQLGYHASAEAEAAGRAEVRRVQLAVAQLPERQRVALACSSYLGISREEIAQLMGISVNSVKTHLRRATQTLASLLEEDS